MESFRNTLKKSALGLALVATTALSANAQNYNNGYNDNSYNNSNSSYNDDNGDDYDGSYQDFYNDLSPYGQWINDPDYGYVWAPDVDQNFRPYYTNGYWAQTEYGNTWVSDYNWGWAAFHYGRWTYDNSYGWVWIPGNEWGPAWVNWRSSDDGYYGWAPMGPGYDVDYYSSNTNFYGPSNWWVFAPQQYLYSNNFRNYVRAPRYNNDYLRRSSIVRVSQRANGYSYFAGPRRTDIERAIGRTIPTYRVRDMKRAGSTRIGGNDINIYRPRIAQQSSRSNGQSFRPQNVRQGTLNIQQGGGRRIETRNQGSFGGRPQQQNDPRMNGNQNAGQPRNVEMRNQDQVRQQQAPLRQQQNGQLTQQLQEQQRNQLREQQNGQRNIQLQEQQRNQIREQQNQQRSQDQMRQQQEQQRAQQQQMRQQQDQQRAQQDQMRQQQEQQRTQQQMRQQQDQQRAQQAQQQQQQQMREQQRAQQQQVRQQQQEQQRVRQVQEQPQRVEQARPQQEQPREARPSNEGGFRRR